MEIMNKMPFRSLASTNLRISPRRVSALAAASALALMVSPSWATVLWQWEPSALSVNSPSTSSTQSFSPILNAQSASTNDAYQFSAKSAEASDSQLESPSLNSKQGKRDLAAELDAFDDGNPQSVAPVDTVESVKISERSHATTQFGEVPNSEAAFASAPAPAMATENVAPAASGAKVVHAHTLHEDIRAVPEMSAFFPILGLLAAVSSTHLLRRRRMAQLARARANA